MSKNILRYKDTRFYKSKNKKGGFKVFIVFILCLAIVVGLSVILGDAINVANFSSLFNVNGVNIKEHSYYAVVMGKYDTETRAQEVASGVSVMGAGAYIWLQDSEYNVIGNVYKSLEDANAVISNISNTNYTPFVKEIKYNKIKFEVENLTKEQKELVKDAVLIIDKVFDQCYNYSIKFDKGEIVSTVVSSELNTLKGDLIVQASKLDAINSVAVSNETLLIKNAYVSIISQLEATILKVIDGTSVNKDLKYLTTSVSIVKYNLYNSINNLK